MLFKCTMLVSCGCNAYSQLKRLEPKGRKTSVGVFLRDLSPNLSEFSRENSERLCQQARSRFEPGISRRPVLEQNFSSTSRAYVIRHYINTILKIFKISTPLELPGANDGH